MSYYFAIIGTKDNPLFELELGTYKQGGDGIPRFREESRHLNQFIAHSSLDIVEEVQWIDGKMYVGSTLFTPPPSLKRTRRRHSHFPSLKTGPYLETVQAC